MKKISIILSLSLVLFLTACEESKYNFSSVEELNASIEKQTEKEGVSKKDLNSLMHELTVNEQEEFLLKLIKKDIKNKTIGKMKAEFEKNGFVSEEAKKNRNMVVDTSNKILFMNLMSSGKLIMVGAYNFSSEKAFLESLKKQAKIEGEIDKM